MNNADLLIFVRFILHNSSSKVLIPTINVKNVLQASIHPQLDARQTINARYVPQENGPQLLESPPTHNARMHVQSGHFPTSPDLHPPRIAKTVPKESIPMKLVSLPTPNANYARKVNFR